MLKTILYIANTPAPSDLDDYRKRGMIAVNASNYNFQLMRGFVQNNHDVHAIFIDSTLKSTRHFVEQDVHFHYLRNYLLIPSQIKQMNLSKDRSFVVCDTLHLRAVLLSLAYIKSQKIKMIGIVTDLYRFFHIKGSMNLKSYLFQTLGEWSMNEYDAYVLVSDKLQSEHFIRQKQILISEGIYDLPTLEDSQRKGDILLYSGALEPEYGILNLMDAVNELIEFPFELHIYSASPTYPDFLKRLSDRVLYKGYLNRTDLLIKQKEAKALINPRPLDLPFNAYSFPSKLIEYMASGTPTLTSALPSIPAHLSSKLYLFEDTSKNGLKIALKAFMEQAYDIHQIKANQAKAIIETEYANHVIASKIEQLIQ